MKLDKPVVVSGALDRRDIMWRTIPSGDPMVTIKETLTKNIQEDPDSQVLLYSSLKTNAEGSLLDAATAILERHHKKQKTKMTYAKCISGGDGIKKKTFSLDVFALFGTLSDEFDPDEIHNIFNAASSGDDAPLALPRTQFTTTTPAANAGTYEQQYPTPLQTQRHAAEYV